MKLRTSTQISFAEAEYAKKKKQTRREKFLAEMEHVVPWASSRSAQHTQAMLIEINAMLIERGLLMSKGTLVDATLIAAPRSTKNQTQYEGCAGCQWSDCSMAYC